MRQDRDKAGTETAIAPSIEATTDALVKLGFVVAAQGRPYDLVCLANDHTRHPMRPDELMGRGWLGIVVDPDGHGFPPLELRVIAHDRGGRVLFAVLGEDGVRFEERKEIVAGS